MITREHGGDLRKEVLNAMKFDEMKMDYIVMVFNVMYTICKGPKLNF